MIVSDAKRRPQFFSPLAMSHLPSSNCAAAWGRTRNVMFAATCALACGRDRTQPQSPQVAGMVGFTTRIARADGGHSIPVAVWYPASAATGAAMRFANYLALADSERPRVSAMSIQSTRVLLTAMLEKGGALRAEVDRWVEAPMVARRDAVPDALRHRAR